VVHSLNVRQPLTVYRFFREIGCRYLGFLPAVNPTPARAESARAGDPARDPAVPDAVLSQQAKTGPAGDPVLPQQAKTGPAGDPVLPQQAKTGPAGDPVDAHTPAAEDYGAFLSRIFDEWIARDTGRIMIQTFEEAARPALGLEHSLCVFRETCGQIPVLEHNGDFFPCDHFVDAEHRLGNIRETPLAELLDSPALRAFGEVKRTQLPKCCRECEVLAMCNGGCPKYRFIRTPEGEPGLNYLCAGLKRFFLHSREPLARWLGRQQPPATKPLAPTEIAGRNGPCPCGSGLKYKKCCAGKREGYGGT
jgi:uncharacterized protein